MNKIVITGATSMIGVSIIEACLKRDVNVIYAVVRPNTKNLAHIPCDERIKIVECDTSSYQMLPSLINDECDTFFHIAWSVTGRERNNDVRGQACNVVYTIDAVHAAKALGCTKFLGAGSQAEYGKLNVDRITPTTPINHESSQSYGIAKYAAGILARRECDRLGLSCFWIRIFSVYGKYDLSTTMVSSTVASLKVGKKMSFTEGKQRWDYLYSVDAGEAFYLIAEKSTTSKVYCLGGGKAKALKDYITTIRDIVNPTAELGFGEIPYTKDSVMNICADISDITKDTGWIPVTSFEDGIRELMKQ